jgi:hypothetical protein
MTYAVSTFAQRPELRRKIDQLNAQSWPEFLLHGNVHHWHFLFDVFARYQLLLFASADELIAVGHTIPLVWKGSVSDLPLTIEDVILRAEYAYRNRQTPNTFCALAIMVDSTHRGQHLSSAVVQEMKFLTRQHACTALIAPVRPTSKTRYPLASMERYVEWKRADGAPLDPWIRVHWRMGAEALGIAPNTLTVEGTVEDWEKWTDMAYPDSGSYVVPGALQPVQIDRARNIGRYEDPNYWMKHPVET